MKITLEPGVSQTLSLVGYNFMFKNGSGDIRVKIMNNDSTVIEESELEVGEQLVEGSERFEKVTIFNLHDETQTIDFEVGSFKRENTREGSSVSVVAVPDIDVATMPPVVVSETPDNPQKYFGAASAQFFRRSGSGVTAFVAPSENINGVVINIARANAGGTGNFAAVIMDTSVPASWVDGMSLALSWHDGSISECVSVPICIPAGFGVYGFCAGATASSSIVCEVL